MDAETEPLIGAYWNAAYQQGLERREVDDEKGTAQDAEWALVQHIKSIRAQVSALQTENEQLRSEVDTFAKQNGCLDCKRLDGYDSFIAGKVSQFRAELVEEKRLHKHWKDQHANEVRRARILKDTTNLPLERVRAYELMGELQGQVEKLQAEVVKLREWYTTAEQQLDTSQRRDYEKGAESMRERAAEVAEAIKFTVAKDATDKLHNYTCGKVAEAIRAIPLKENEG